MTASKNTRMKMKLQNKNKKYIVKGCYCCNITKNAEALLESLRVNYVFTPKIKLCLSNTYIVLEFVAADILLKLKVYNL